MVNSKTLNKAGSEKYKLEALESTDYDLIDIKALNSFDAFPMFNNVNVEIHKVNPTDAMRHFGAIKPAPAAQNTKGLGAKRILREGSDLRRVGSSVRVFT